MEEIMSMDGKIVTAWDGSHDQTHKRLKKLIEKPETRYLWTPDNAITFTPHLLSKVYGDGRALFALATINQRPAYYVIRACSTWGSGMDQEDPSGPDFAEMTDEILTALEEEFGSGRCAYSGGSLFLSRDERSCKCEECEDNYIASWPEVDGYGGCSWRRMKWPSGHFDVTPHPASRKGDLLNRAVGA